MKTLIIFCDGSCWPNPGGDIGIGMVVHEAENFKLTKHNERSVESSYSSIKITERFSKKYSASEFNKNTSNNVAEYIAIKTAIEYAKKSELTNIYIFSDSQMAVRQMNGEYLVKEGKAYSQHAIMAIDALVGLVNAKEKVDVVWIPREFNSRADALSKI